MATDEDRAVGRQLRTLFNVGVIRELGDGQLLERFATDRGEGAELAFAALVERHGPMVLRVARGVLDDPHDAQDAFQATFLVLVSKARGLWVRDSIGPWLQQVAYRTSTCLRSSLARRRRLERRAAPVVEEAPEARPIDDLARVLLEEVDRLPERYRAPVVLCDLEGRTHEQAARALGWPVGTVKSRQSRARDRLRDRLRRRGVAPGLAPLATWPAIEATLPASLVDLTTVAAVRFVASRAIAPGPAVALAREVIRPMIILRWTKAAALLAVLGAAGSGAGWIAQGQGQKPADDPKPLEQIQAAPPADPSLIEVKPGKFRLTISERGSLEPASSRDVYSEVEGVTVIIMIKPEGTPVKEGDIVGELDSASLRDMLVNQRIAVQQAEAAYKQSMLVREVAEYAIREYVQGLLPQERANLNGRIAQAQANIERGRDRLVQAKRDRERLDEALRQVLRRVGFQSPADVVADLTLNDRLEAAKLEGPKAEFELEVAQTEQKVFETYSAEKRKKALAMDVERAKAQEFSQQSSWELEKSKARKLERQIERCVLKAPGDGTVVYASAPGRNVAQIEEGATVRERQKVFSVIDLAGPLRLNTKVHEPLVDRLKRGQPVQVKVDAVPDRVLTGTVLSVAPMPDANSFLADGKKVYTTFIGLEKGAARLRPGMSATAEILIDEADNVLQVPISCLWASERGPRAEHFFVPVKSPAGAFEWREVTLGRSDQRSIEIKAGLKPGDLVAREPKDGMGLDLTNKFRQ